MLREDKVWTALKWSLLRNLNLILLWYQYRIWKFYNLDKNMWCMRCMHVMHEVQACDAWGACMDYKVFEARSCESQWSSSICAAMVTKIPSKVFFQVEIDSMITYSDSNWPTMWCTSNSRKIFPVGWCVQNNIQLTPPPGMQFLNTAHLISMFVFCDWNIHGYVT